MKHALLILALVLPLGCSSSPPPAPRQKTWAELDDAARSSFLVQQSNALAAALAEKLESELSSATLGAGVTVKPVQVENRTPYWYDEAVFNAAAVGAIDKSGKAKVAPGGTFRLRVTIGEYANDIIVASELSDAEGIVRLATDVSRPGPRSR
jgi:hypothetical protein